MRIDILTLFPEVLQPYFAASIIGRAQRAGVVELHTHHLRDYSRDIHRKVDDRPFGGGPGMVLMCQPVCDAVAAIEKLDPRPALRILLTPQGRVFDQDTAGRYATTERLLLLCGHYEGFDERIVQLLNPEEVSIGDFVLTGGEIAALAIVDSVVRLLPGALGNEAAAAAESFQRGRLDYPQFTRPREYCGLRVPEILLTGNHAEIQAWRESQAEQRTRQRRPDLSRARECGASHWVSGPDGARARTRLGRSDAGRLYHDSSLSRFPGVLAARMAPRRERQTHHEKPPV